MRSPTVVLNSLASKSKDADYKYRRLYRNLYNPHFYLEAYAKIYANEGNMTAGTDGKTIDGMNIERVNQIIARLQDFSYQPQPAKRTYIPKKNGGKRPLGIPSFDDKLVQEVVRESLKLFMRVHFRTDHMDSDQTEVAILHSSRYKLHLQQ